MTYQYFHKTSKIPYSRYYCLLPENMVSYGTSGMFYLPGMSISTQQRVVGGMFSRVIDPVKRDASCEVYPDYESAFNNLKSTSEIIIVIDIPSQSVNDNKFDFIDLFPEDSTTKELVSVFGANELFNSRKMYPASYHDLIEEFDYKPGATNNAAVIANLFHDYWDKGTGIKRIVFFHTNRNHTQLAKELVDELSKKEHSNWSNEQIAEAIRANYMLAKEKPGFDTKGSFARRANFAIVQLSHGYCESVEQYNVHYYERAGSSVRNLL